MSGILNPELAFYPHKNRPLFRASQSSHDDSADSSYLTCLRYHPGTHHLAFVCTASSLNHSEQQQQQQNLNVGGSEVYAGQAMDVMQGLSGDPSMAHLQKSSSWIRLDVNPADQDAVLNDGNIVQTFDGASHAKLSRRPARKQMARRAIVNDLAFDTGMAAENTGSVVLAAALSDASACIWDLRMRDSRVQGQECGRLAPVFRLRDTERRAYLSCALYGYHLACGTELAKDDAKIRLWDLRMPQNGPAGELVHSLGDDCTQLEFYRDELAIHSSGDSTMMCEDGAVSGLRLVSGSTDGLCCVYDYDHIVSKSLKNQQSTENIDTNHQENGDTIAAEDGISFGNGEDDALLAVLNTNSSVAKFGRFYGGGSPSSGVEQYIWTLTHTEQLTIWSLATGTKLADLGDVRSYFAPELGVDYVIDAVFDEHSGSLRLICGGYEGIVHQVLVGMNGLTLEQSWSGGHGDVVRSVVILSNGGDASGQPILVTCGEDGLMIGWTRWDPKAVSGQHLASPTAQASSAKHHRSSFRPY